MLPIYPESYIEYLVFFHADRDYFECHEVMEAFWKETAGGELSQTWLGLIQVAVSQYHERRENLAGARKMMDSAVRNLAAADWDKLGIDGAEFMQRLQQRQTQLHLPSEEQPAFTDLDIPIKDTELLKACRSLAERRGITWLQASDRGNPGLIHKHTLRDRTPVLQDRERSKSVKRLAREKGTR